MIRIAGFGLITHQIFMINEWEAKNILTRSISYDILRVLIKDMFCSDVLNTEVVDNQRETYGALLVLPVAGCDFGLCVACFEKSFLE